MVVFEFEVNFPPFFGSILWLLIGGTSRCFWLVLHVDMFSSLVLRESDMRSVFAFVFILLSAFPSLSFALDKVGGAVSQGVTATLVRRGFLSTDPRVLSTLTAMGVRTGANVAAVGSGATWLGVAARITPWATGAVAVYQGINWYFDIQGKVYLAPPGSTTGAPIFSSGTVAGQNCWGVSGAYDCFGSPQESLSYLFSVSRKQYPDASYGVPQLVQDNPNQYTATYNYSIPSLYLNNNSGTKVLTTRIANITCAAGSGYNGTSGSGCSNADLNNSPYAASQVKPVADLTAAYNALPEAVKSAAADPGLVTEIANRNWKDASADPSYSGVPFDTSNPVAPADVVPANNPNWPKTSDVVAPVTASPYAAPVANPNQVNPTSGATKIDLGVDPGVQAPTLDSPPTNLFKPVSDLMSPFLSWQVPSHSSVCPTWQASPSIAGHAFNIDVSSHCSIAEQYRGLITGAALAAWIVCAFFIVLSA